ncbi:hypothetical protein RJT34_15864 [Clitoria ternatea]|uniref:Uncharacterized protein n=1 Tax=Clitoria ternatea TaxID=43366 RepID=A0AAN9J972_CLITE
MNFSKRARKALRALKGLVKLQAHVRGYLVWKQEAAKLHNMQALIRAQATERFDATMNNVNSVDRSHSGSGQRKAKVKSRKSNNSMSDFVDDPSFKILHSPFSMP